MYVHMILRVPAAETTNTSAETVQAWAPGKTTVLCTALSQHTLVGLKIRQSYVASSSYRAFSSWQSQPSKFKTPK